MDISIIGVPMDLGGRRRGTDMGPSAIRYAGLHRELERLGHRVADMGDVPVPIRETCRAGDEKAKFLSEIVAVCEQVSVLVERSLAQGRFPVVIGGDHSVAVGTVGGAVKHLDEVGVIWMDAHGDFNTADSSPSGNVHGMPLAALVGLGPGPLVNCCAKAPKVKAENVVLLGVRELDPGERELLKEAGVVVLTMREIDEKGIATMTRRALAIAGGNGVRPVHLSMDMDVIDPAYAPGVGSPESGGLTYREAHLALEIMAESGIVRSVELTEVNPIFDLENHTAVLAVELIGSVLGKRIM